MNGTPINYDQSNKKRISQPMGFGKKSSAIDGLETSNTKIRKSTMLVGG